MRVHLKGIHRVERRLATGEMHAGRRRATLALLTLGWFGSLNLCFALPVALTALAIHFVQFSRPIASRYVVTVWAMAATLIFSAYAGVLAKLLQFLARMPSDAAMGVIYGVRLDVVAVPVCLAAFLWWTAKPSWRLSPSVSTAAALGSLIIAASIWSSRSRAALDFETLHNPHEFAAILGSRPGEVLWVDAKSEGWQVLGRPQWGSAQQSASVVFSRPLAMLWRERAQALLENGLIQANVFAPWQSNDASVIPHVRREALERICVRSDGPVAIIFPLEKGQSLPADVIGAVWTLPHPRFLLDINEKNIWHEVDRYVAVSCADSTGPERRGGDVNPPALRGGLL